MHIYVAVDGSQDAHSKFKEFIQGIPLKARDGTITHATVRFVQVYDVVVDEYNLPELIPYIRQHEKVSLSGRAISTAIGLLSKFFPFLSQVDPYFITHTG